MWLLQAPAQSAQDILDNGILSQQAVAAAMDDLWKLALDSDLYKAVADIGAFFFIATLAIFIFNWTKDALNEGEAFLPYENWIWLVVAVALLANGGELLKDLTFITRDVMNELSEQVLTSSLSGSKNLIEAFNEASTNAGVQGWYEQELRRCAGITDPQARQDCIDKALQTANEIAKRGAPNSAPNLWQRVTGALNIGSTIETALTGLMLALGVAVQWLVEICWILTAIVGPIAVGGTLLPVRQKSLIAWLIAFYSLGLYKLFYNILVGMVAMVQLSTGNANTLLFSVAVGLLAPVLALVLASGGGLATLISLGSIAGLSSGKVGGSAISAASGTSAMAARMAYHPAARAAGSAYQNAVSPTWRRRIRARAQDATTPIVPRRN